MNDIHLENLSHCKPPDIFHWGVLENETYKESILSGEQLGIINLIKCVQKKSN